MAIDSGAESLIVLTKADEADVDTPAFSIVEAVAGSVPVIVTSVVDRTGLDELPPESGQNARSRLSVRAVLASHRS